MDLKVGINIINAPFFADISKIGHRKITGKRRGWMRIRKLRANTGKYMFCYRGTDLIIGRFFCEFNAV
jgi:hypothetical protein